MARKRKKAKSKSDKKAEEESKKFLYTILAVFVIFVIGFVTLQFL